MEDACAIMKAAVRAEAARITQSGASASAIKIAYHTTEDHDRVTAMEPVAWIVDHKHNDYPVSDAEDTPSQLIPDAL